MKRVLLIAIVLIVGGFFAFFDVDIESENQFEFLEAYKSEIGCSDYYAEKITSSDENGEGLRIIFEKCAIDSSNVKSYTALSEKIAIKLNQELNEDNKYKNIITVFKPLNVNGIKINDLITIDELKYTYSSDKL